MKRLASILYVIDGDLSNMNVLDEVKFLAKEHQASLTLLDVIESLHRTDRMAITYMPTGEIRNRIVAKRLNQLEELISMIGQDNDDLRPRVLFGKRAREIAREAAEGGYDLVIKTPEKGRTDKYLLRNCKCPLWLLQPDDYDTAGQICTSLARHFTAQEKQQPAGFGITARAGYFLG